MSPNDEAGSREYPARPIVGVGAVVWRDDRLLLVRRARPPRRGQWSIPGGGQQLGETVFEAATREVREETGVEAAVTGLIDVVDSVVRDDAGRVHYHYTLVDVAAEWRAGEARPLDEIDRVEWADPDDLTAFELWSETLRIIDLARRIRAGGQR